MEKLGDRLRLTLKRAGLTPRHVGGATRIHFVTIYRQINEPDGGISPLHQQTLVAALDRIDLLVSEGKLPLTEKLSRKEKTDRLKSLLEQTD